MIETLNCVYQTPCGWCSKWDKKCDCKIDLTDTYINNDQTNSCSHKWTPTNRGGGYAGVDGKCKTYTTYVCKYCGLTKDVDN